MEFLPKMIAWHDYSTRTNKWKVVDTMEEYQETLEIAEKEKESYYGVMVFDMGTLAKRPIVISMNKFDGDFTCTCGNQPTLDGFSPCDKHGVLVDPNPDWEGLFKCEVCERIYSPKEEV